MRQLLAEAERVVASTLTVVECRRALVRGAVTGRITRAEELAALKLLDIVSASWVTLELTGRVLDRAATRFPHEPVRTLDALHLATATAFHQAYSALTMVSLDDRIRTNAERLGLTVAP